MGLPGFCFKPIGSSRRLLENSTNSSLLENIANDSLFENFTIISSLRNNSDAWRDYDEATLIEMKRMIYFVIVPIACLFGVCGNVLNLITLRNRVLQTVPFMYIRLVAIFDLIALSLIFISSLGVAKVMPYHPWLVVYQSHMELVLINTFLSASLYCALVLTVERYILVSRPHLRSTWDPKRLAQVKIACSFLLALLLHVPMSLLYSVGDDFDEPGKFVKVSSRRMLCNEPSATIFGYYNHGRECVRLTAVVIMSVVNGVIARKLQIAKRNRRRMTKKQQKARATTSNRKEMALLKSFTEKKLTVLMIAICIIYLIGNLPQAVNMVLHTDEMENKFSYQIFRAFGNVCEVLNHCLNFYVFCIASTEYSRAFLQNCMCMRSIIVRVPCCAKILYSRKPSSASEGTSLAFRTTDLLRFKNPDVSPPNSSIVFNDNTSLHGERDLVYL
uniref:G-protein coupled receptors family 1 profile domain-containing protein n=1 Tax=Plectus sambesii TaxID=2011161 RepID=A0A914VV81_9BILA